MLQEKSQQGTQVVEGEECKDESASFSMEVTLASFWSPAMEGVDTRKLLAVKCDAMAILHQEDVWICNRSQQSSNMECLGHKECAQFIDGELWTYRRGS